MGKIAFVYPGQGSQQVGMGLDLYENAEIKKSMDRTRENIKINKKTKMKLETARRPMRHRCQ